MRKLNFGFNELSAISNTGDASFCLDIDLSVKYFHTTYDFKGLGI